MKRRFIVMSEDGCHWDVYTKNGEEFLTTLNYINIGSEPQSREQLRLFLNAIENGEIKTLGWKNIANN